MLKLRYVLFPFIICFLVSNISYALYRGEQLGNNHENVPTRLIIKLNSNESLRINPGKSSSGMNNIPGIQELAEKYPIKRISPFMETRSIIPSMDLFRNIFILEVEKDIDLAAMKDDLKKLPNIEYAEIDQIAEFYNTPDDPSYTYQWSFNNIAQEHYYIIRNMGSYNDELVMTTGAVDADIDAHEVFLNPPDNTTSVIVAIIDSGVDMDHPDLEDNIWTNPREIEGDGLDNDNNGFIDDIHGWDFGGSIMNIGQGDNDPTDEDGHGTHCAGIVAAVTNNTLGISGLADNCTIMPLKIDPLPLVSIIAKAIIYAADNGADVINMSFGIVYRSDLIEDALGYARSRGVILCVAAGNDGAEEYNYPASSDLTIAIGATNDMDHVTSFSTYGEHINVCAPGLSILSLRADYTDMYASGYPREPEVHIIDTVYYLASGTSMSSPHVVGVAAYVRAVSPGLTPDKTQEIIEQTADDYIDPYGVGWNLSGWDKYSGHGRVNLKYALRATPDVRAQIQSPNRHEIVSHEVNIIGTADGNDFRGYFVEYGEEKTPSNWLPITSSVSAVTDNLLGVWNTYGLSGIYTIRLRVGHENVAYTTVYVANSKTAYIVSPADQCTLTGYAAIHAEAHGKNFKNLLLEYRPKSNPDDWVKIDSLTIPVFGDLVTYWSVGEMTEGYYFLRLTVFFYDNSEITDEIAVFIRSPFSSDHTWKQELYGLPTIISNYGDFDNDGAMEIIVGTSTGLEVFNPDGTRKIKDIPDFPDNNFMVPVAVGDLDCDGKDDIVALGYDPPMVYAYPSSAPEFVSYLANFPNIYNYAASEAHFTKLFLKDINNDCHDEIIVHIYGGYGSKVFIISSDGSSQKELDYINAFLPADLNADGIDELYAFYQGFSALRQIDEDGNTIDELIMELDGGNFRCLDISACDIENDGLLELIVYGYHTNSGYKLYAFRSGFEIVPGWPHDMGIDPFVLPTVPVFGDIDNDGELEYVSGYFDIDISYVMAWNIDGSSLLPGSPNGYFANTQQLGMLNMIMLSDLDGDDRPEIIACANDDLFSLYMVQRIYAWDSEGNTIPDFPLVTSYNSSTSYRFTPTIGDIDQDGFVDLFMTTADSSLIFVNRPGCSYNTCSSPVPHWRYNRRMNNIAPGLTPCNPTLQEENEIYLPTAFTLSQNYPNPFNPSTIIEYSLPIGSHTDIAIFNILGQKIKTIVNENIPAGKHTAFWDGTDSRGNSVASGIYFYHIRADEFTETKKMLMVK